MGQLLKRVSVFVARVFGLAYFWLSFGATPVDLSILVSNDTKSKIPRRF